MKRLIIVLFALAVSVTSYAGNVTTDLLGNVYSGPANFDVLMGDQTTPAALIYFNQVYNTTTLTVETTVQGSTDAREITVADTAGFVDGAYIGIFSTTTNRFYQGHQIGAPVGNVISLDSPVDSVFPIGAVVGVGTDEMNVNGSVTTQVFGLRGADPGLDITLDVTNIMITMITSTAVDLNKFGNIAGGLTNGLMMRGVDGITYNFGNIKTNADMVTWGATFIPFDASNPGQGVFGLTAKFRFAGQDNAGVAIRIDGTESLEIWVQDNLLPAEGITYLKISALAHVVLD